MFSSDTKDDLTGQSSGNSTGYCKQLTCMDVNTDSDDVLYKSKLNIDGLKTYEGRSTLGGQTLRLRQQSSHQQQQDF
jgi:hypothetical protein